MSDGAGEPIYSVDSSALMDWQARYYPGDVFKSLLQKIDGLVLPRVRRRADAQGAGAQGHAVGGRGLGGRGRERAPRRG